MPKWVFHPRAYLCIDQHTHSRLARPHQGSPRIVSATVAGIGSADSVRL